MASTLFSYPKFNGRLLNLGNTVLVNMGQLRNKSDQWCLGYLQDIKDEQLLIDLDCTQFPPFWIGTEYVWYHHLTDFGPPSEYPLQPPRIQVYVALRDELDGPFVFRPAQLLNRPSQENLYVCLVIVTMTEGDRDDDQLVQVVHQWQVVLTLPTDEGPLLGRLRQTGNLDEIPVLKQMVRTENIDILRKFTNFPDRRMHGLVFMAVNRAGFQRNGNGRDLRVFATIGERSIMVLLFDLHLWRVADNNAAGDAAPLLHTFPLELLSEILSSLDFHSQLRAKCVSSVWCCLLRIQPASAVIIDFASFARRPYFTDFINASEGYYLGTLLDRAVSRKTKALSLCNLNADKLYGHDHPVRIVEIVINLLAIKKVGLLAIVLKNCRFLLELTLTWEADDFTVHHLFHISKLLLVCKRLLLLNHTTVEFPGCDCGVAHGWVSSPQWVTVTFPSLEFHPCADERESIIRFVNALEPQLPSVDEIKTHIKERHQFFVETVPYPDGWQRFRQFLRRHTFTDLSSLDSFWNELDLRNFDKLPLTKMVLLPLENCIDAVFENL